MIFNLSMNLIQRKKILKIFFVSPRIIGRVRYDILLWTTLHPYVNSRRSLVTAL